MLGRMSGKSQRARVSLTFPQGPDTGIVYRGDAAVAGTTGNDALPNPPVTLTELRTMLDAYNAAITALLSMAARSQSRQEIPAAMQ
jgi:hypothetical protein